MFQFLRQLWHRLCARLRFCGGVQYLAGTASLPSPLSPAEEKALLARMANGALRDALSLLDQCRVAQGQLDSRAVLDILGLAGSVQTVELMDCILRRDAAGALTRLDGLYRGGKDVAAMLGELGDLARDMTILKAAPDGAAALLTDFRAVAAAGLRQSPHAPVQGIAAQRALRLAEAAIQRLGAQVNPKIVLSVFAAKFRAL